MEVLSRKAYPHEAVSTGSRVIRSCGADNTIKSGLSDHEVHAMWEDHMARKYGKTLGEKNLFGIRAMGDE